MDEWRYEPSKDLGLGPAERFRSERRESGLLESAGHLLWWSFIRSYLKLWHRFEVRGTPPVEAPFVLVANHSTQNAQVPPIPLVKHAQVPARLQAHRPAWPAGVATIDRRSKSE